MLVYFSGVLSIGAMSISMLLALRAVVFEPCVGGLDKMCRLHQWLGITALVIPVVHGVIYSKCADISASKMGYLRIV